MIIKSNFSGKCRICRESYGVDERVDWVRGVGSAHLRCLPGASAQVASPVSVCCVLDANTPSVWYFTGPFEVKDVPKRARWLWHGEDCADKKWPCKACPAGVPKKRWWTDSVERLGDLVRHYEAASGAKPPLDFFNPVTETLARTGAEIVAQALAASGATDADVDLPRPAGLNYLPYQKAGIAYAMARSSTLIADEMGLGKTIQAIGVVNADESAQKILVLCPASLRANWRRELEKWLTRPLTIDLPENGDLPDSAANITIVNYDKLVGKSGKVMHDKLMTQDYDILVADEAHFLKNPKAQRTVAVLGSPASWDGKKPAVPGLASRARRFLPLTGTPILNKPIETFQLLSVLSPTEFGDFWRFARRYCGAQKVQHSRSGASHWDFSGATHLDELQERMRKHVMVRRLKADVLKELPAKRRQIVTLTVEDDKIRRLIADERAAYDGEASETDEMARAIGGDDYREVVSALWASQRADGDSFSRDEERDDERGRRNRGTQDKAGLSFYALSAARHQIALAKVPAVIEHLDGMIEEGVEKILVFAHHLDVVAKLKEHFGDRAVAITGETKMSDRQGIVDRFQTDPSVQIFIGNIRAAGVGLTLTAACHVVFAELDWVPANVTQAEDRAHRIGQLNTVLIQHLVLDESLDAQFAKVLVEKQDIADAALDNERAAIDIRQPVRLPPRQPKLPEGVQKNDRGVRSYPAVSEEERALVHQAVRIIAGMCDGAQKLDGHGYNKIDTQFGTHLAHLDALTDGQAWAGKRLARTYRRQLPPGLVAALGVGAKPETVKRGSKVEKAQEVA